MIRPARPDEIAPLVGAYDWLFAPPGSQPPMWDPEAAARRLRELIAVDDGEVLAAGAQRVSVGGALTWVATAALTQAAEALRDGDLSVLAASAPKELFY